MGSSINDVTVLGGGGKGFFDDKDLVTKRVTMGVSKIFQNCVTSFMDDPFRYHAHYEKFLYLLCTRVNITKSFINISQHREL